MLVGASGILSLGVEHRRQNCRQTWVGILGEMPTRLKYWSHPPGSNRRPADYESAALPTELGWLGLSQFNPAPWPPMRRARRAAIVKMYHLEHETLIL